MRFQLDENAARWFNHALLRPAAVVRLNAAFVHKLREAWDGSERVLDLSRHLDDKTFIAFLIELLVATALSGNAYLEPFIELAKRIDKSFKLSIVDRLGALYAPPPPVPIKGVSNDTRERAMRKVKDRHRLP